jgi:hypothetical protein
MTTSRNSRSSSGTVVMLGDAVNAKKAAGQAKDTLEVIDVAQLLARSVRSATADIEAGQGD